LEFLDRISKEALNIKLYVIPFSTSGTDTCGQMDRLTAGGQADGRLWRKKQALFATMQTRLTSSSEI